MAIRDAMAEGVPSGGCPIAAPEHEHEKLTVLTDQLRKEFEVYGTSNCAANAMLIDTLRALAELYCEHIWKENYPPPMADKLLSAADRRRLRISCIWYRMAKDEDAWRSVEQLSTRIGLCLECNEREPCAA